MSCYPDYDYRLTVLSYEKRPGRCPSCGASALLFVCHGHKVWPERGQIQNRCKPCAVQEAGGEELVFVKSTFPGLRNVWTRNARPQATAAQAAALAAHRAG